MRCPAHNTILDAKGSCPTCTRATLITAELAIGNTLKLSPIGRMLCGALAGSLPEILSAMVKASEAPMTTAPTYSELDEVLKKWMPTVPAKA